MIQVLDFGASRDGIPASERGSRKLLRFDDPSASSVIELEHDYEDEP